MYKCRNICSIHVVVTHDQNKRDQSAFSGLAQLDNCHKSSCLHSDKGAKSRGKCLDWINNNYTETSIA